MQAKRLAYCRRCSGETAQTFIHIERPGVEIWTCCSCSSTLMSIGDIPDSDGFAISIAEMWLKRESIVASEVDREEVQAEARAALWISFLRFDPTRGLGFRSYAAWKVSQLLTDWIRVQRGRTYGTDRSGLKPHATAISFDAYHSDDDRGEDRLDRADAKGTHDSALDSSADFSRALELGSGSNPREERSMGRTTYARAS